MRAYRLISRIYYDYPGTKFLLIEHSEAVARKALQMARALGGPSLDLEFIEEAALLHDIGIIGTDAPPIGCLGSEHYIRHGVMGREILEAEGLARHALVAERHVGAGLTPEEIEANGFPLPVRPMLPITIEEKIICLADKFFSKGGDPSREKTLEEVRAQVAGWGEANLLRFDFWLQEYGQLKG